MYLMRLKKERTTTMHSFAKQRHSKSGKASTKTTRGLVLDTGWRYDLMEWFFDTFLFRGKLRELCQGGQFLISRNGRNATSAISGSLTGFSGFVSAKKPTSSAHI